MTGFTVNSFKGQIPKLASRLLQPEYAGRAENTQMRTQELAPINEAVDTDTIFSETPAVIDAFYHQDTGDFLGWFWFNYYTDAFFAVLPNDKFNRVYFYDELGELRISDQDNYDVTQVDVNGHLLPSVTTSWKLGVPQPDNAPGVTNGGGGVNVVEEDRAYVYTFVDHWGGEGPPSPPSAIIPNVKIDDECLVSGFQTPPAGYNFAGGKYRIYRAVSGTVRTDYQFVGEEQMDGDGTFHDAIQPQELGEICPTRTWYPPPENVQGMCLSLNGTLVAFKDNTLFFSEPFMPSAWPPEYQQTVDADIQAVAAASASVAVLTNSKPFSISGTIPTAVQIRKLDNEEACINRRSVATIGNSVYYASPNGIAVVTQSEGAIASREAMTREQWHNFNPTEGQAFNYDDKYGFLYDTRALSNTDIHGTDNPYAPQVGIWWMDNDEQYFKSWNTQCGVPAIRPHDEKLFLVCDDLVLRELNPSDLEGGRPLNYKWRSKVFEAQRPVNFSVIQIKAKDYPVLLTVYADEKRKFHGLVYNDNGTRLPSGFKALSWELQLDGSAVVYEINLYESVLELATI